MPPYALDLNPVKMVWNHAKYADLANFLLEDIEHLRRSVIATLENTRPQRQLLRSFFEHAKLGL